MSTIQKFDYNHFEILDTGDLFINIWSYSYNLKNVCKEKCKLCHIYRQYCTKILKKRWNKKWGNFNKTMRKIYNNDDEDFINLAEYSSAEKHFIVKDLQMIQEANS